MTLKSGFPILSMLASTQRLSFERHSKLFMFCISVSALFVCFLHLFALNFLRKMSKLLFFSCCTVFLSSESAARHKWYETWEVLYRHVASCLSYSASSVMYTVIITIEREIHFFNLFLSALTQVAGFTSYFLKVCITCSANGILLFQSNLIDMLLHLSLPRHIRSLTSTYSRLFYPTLFSKHPLSLLETCPYHRTPLALDSPSKVSFKPSQLISSWLLLFSMNLT